jgi:hypothetical protein
MLASFLLRQSNTYNGQKKNDSRQTTIYIQNTSLKIIDRATSTPLKTGSELRCSGINFLDDIANGKKYIKLNLSQKIIKDIKKDISKKKKLCTLIAGNKKITV